MREGIPVWKDVYFCLDILRSFLSWDRFLRGCL